MAITYHAGRRVQGSSDGVTTGYQVSSISYDNKSSSSSSQNTYMLGIGFNADGTKMYRTGYSSTKAIFQYTLSTAWDISTSSYDNVSFSLPSPVSVAYGIEWNGDGTKFVVCDTSTGDLYQFSLSTAYDISTTNSTPTTYDPSETTSPDAIKFNSDGTKAFVIGQGNDTIYRYSLSTAYDITTMSYDSNSFTYPSGYYGTGLELNSDGTEMYLQDHVGNSLRRYTLSTAYDLSTASLTSSFSTSSQFSSNTASALCFSTDGTKLYISGYGASDFQYSTSGTASDKTLLTDVQVGSRFEATDTRKMYHYNQPAFDLSKLLGYYKFEETTGNFANEDLGDVDWADLTAQNTPSYQQTGKLGDCIDTNNRNSYTISPSFDWSNNDWSVSAWVQMDAGISNAYRGFFSTRQSGGAWLTLGTNNNGKIACEQNGGGGYDLTDSSVTATGSGWNHVVFTYDATANESNFYVNNVLVDTFTQTSIGTSSQYVSCVWYAGQSNHWDGKIDELSIWNEVLTASKVSRIWNGGTGIVLEDATSAITWSEEGT